MADPQRRLEQQAPNAPHRILVVDDDRLVRTALVRLLQLAGYEARGAASGAEALAALEDAPADAVLSDHLMPEMNGLELLGRVRERHPDCLRLLLTGQAEQGVARDALERGEVYRFVSKPWDNAELRALLQRAFAELDAERERRRPRLARLPDARRTASPP